MIKYKDTKIYSFFLDNKIYFIAFAVVGLFLFLRFYNIHQSLLFIGDMGRDFLVLHEWQQTLKPPLLGPQTSALPFNQSAAYFYLLMPLFILLNQSLYSTLITSALLHILLFIAGLYILRKNARLQYSLLISGFLVAIIPQFILQHRYIWNPSFVGAFLLTSFYSYQLLVEKYSLVRLIVFTLSLSLAASFSYSVLPVLLGYLLLILLQNRSFIVKFSLGMLLSLMVVNASTIFFELRHNFTLTNMMMHREKVSQVNIDIGSKLFNLYQYNHLASTLIASITLLVIIYLVIKQIKDNPKDKIFLSSLILFLSTLFITLLLPFALQRHYLFGIITSMVIVISLLPKKSVLFILILLSIQWLRPAQLNKYFQPIYRSIVDTNSCIQSSCQNISQPAYIAVQSDRHPYHEGREFHYLYEKSGCEIGLISDPTQNLKQMIVVSDDSNYTHNSTKFHELSQFGPSVEIDQMICSKDLKIHLLEKI